MSNKPEWKDAPEWATYLAMDPDGDWYWYEFMPDWNGEHWDYHGWVMLAAESGVDASITLEPRQ